MELMGLVLGQCVVAKFKNYLQIESSYYELIFVDVYTLFTNTCECKLYIGHEVQPIMAFEILGVQFV